jgi:hypothetical protein
MSIPVPERTQKAGPFDGRLFPGGDDVTEEGVVEFVTACEFLGTSRKILENYFD